MDPKYPFTLIVEATTGVRLERPDLDRVFVARVGDVVTINTEGKHKGSYRDDSIAVSRLREIRIIPT